MRDDDMEKGHPHGSKKGKSPHGKIDHDEFPFIVFWEVTRACPLACDHCRAEAMIEPSPEELSYQEGIEFLDELADFEKVPILVLTGGDPLMRDDIFDLVGYAVDKGIRTAFTPAPTRSLDEENIKKLKEKGVSRMALSLDGSSPEIHDAVRGEGSYNAVLRAASVSENIGLPIQINTMVTEETVDDLPEIAEKVEDLGAVMWALFFLVEVGRGEHLESVSAERAEEVMNFLYEEDLKRPYMVKTTEACHYRRVVMQRSGCMNEVGIGDGIGRSFGVSDGNGIVFVSRKGEIFPSGFLPLEAGNIREDGLLQVYRENELFQELRDKSKLKGDCGVCGFNEICGGSRARAYAATGDHLQEDPLCVHDPES